MTIVINHMSWLLTTIVMTIAGYFRTYKLSDHAVHAVEIPCKFLEHQIHADPGVAVKVIATNVASAQFLNCANLSPTILEGLNS